MRRDVTVTVTDSHAAALEQLAQRLARAGMQVDEVLAAAGVITGSLPDDRREEIAALDGVAAVEEQLPIQLAPPGADVQ